MLHRIQPAALLAAALLGALTLLPARSVQAAQIGFASGLAGWTTQGDVQAQAGIATLTDSSGFLSSLYRPTATTPGAGYRLEFDISLGLSSGLPQLGFPDTTFVTLYQTNDLGSFSLVPGAAPAALSVATWNSGGLVPGGGTATLGASPLGAAWQRVSFSFTNSYAYAIPTFELFGQNGIAGDSQIRLANVRVTPAIPEPAAAAVFALGLLLVRASLLRSRTAVD